ncbi:hypothetical protein CPC08DRAFT_265534 [Agrocybe pediades]|nr:hypothetical protein CPC08DRAFT_265534 [Agrocybe pediades]
MLKQAFVYILHLYFLPFHFLLRHPRCFARVFVLSFSYISVSCIYLLLLPPHSSYRYTYCNSCTFLYIKDIIFRCICYLFNLLNILLLFLPFRVVRNLSFSRLLWIW